MTHSNAPYGNECFHMGMSVEYGNECGMPYGNECGMPYGNECGMSVCYMGMSVCSMTSCVVEYDSTTEDVIQDVIY